jgi:hypothetical protein
MCVWYFYFITRVLVEPFLDHFRFLRDLHPQIQNRLLRLFAINTEDLLEIITMNKFNTFYHVVIFQDRPVTYMMRLIEIFFSLNSLVTTKDCLDLIDQIGLRNPFTSVVYRDSRRLANQIKLIFDIKNVFTEPNMPINFMQLRAIFQERIMNP